MSLSLNSSSVLLDLLDCRGHSWYELSQCQPTLQCNVVSYWLIPGLTRGCYLFWCHIRIWNWPVTVFRCRVLTGECSCNYSALFVANICLNFLPMLSCLFCIMFNTLRPRQDGRHFAEDLLKFISLNEYVWISIETSLKFVRKGTTGHKSALVHAIA